MKSIFKYIVAVCALLPMVHNGAYAQTEDNLDAIVLDKKLTHDKANKYTITLSTFVTGEDHVETTPVDLVLVLDYSSSMCAADGTYVQVATGNTLDILCPDLNWNKNKSKEPNPFFNQKRQIKIGNNVYDLMKYTQSKGSRTNSMAVSHDLATLPNTADNNWYYWDPTASAGGQGGPGGAGAGAKGAWVEYGEMSANDIVYSQIRIDILRSSCIDFVNEVAANSSASFDNRVSIIKFCASTAVETNLISANDPDNVATLRDKIVNGTKFDGNVIAQGTAPEKGLQQATNLFFDNDGKETTTNGARVGSNKVVVLFSDGVPYSDHTSTSGRNQDGTQAILNSQILKERGVTVYSVGLLNGEADGWSQNKIENFLRFISSDFNAKGKGLATNNTANYFDQKLKDDFRPDPVAEEGGYYSLVEGGNLSEIFTAIANHNTLNTADLTERNTAVIDVMSNSFTLPAGCKPEDIKVWTETCYGLSETYTTWKTANSTATEDDWKEYVSASNLDDYVKYVWKADTLTENRRAKQYYEDSYHQPTILVDNDKKSVTVSNFNYTYQDDGEGDSRIYGNWVGERLNDSGQSLGYYGRRLMIQFEVDYLGEPGFSVPSNDITSGIYLNDRLIKKYERPEKDFPGLCIVKEGLKAGESAIFEVTGLFGKGDGYAEGTIKVILTGTGELVTVDDLYYKNGLYNVGDPKPAVKAINNLKIDETYSVKELGWSWAYDSASYHIATGGVVSQTLVNPGMTPEAVKAAWTTASTSSPSEKNQYFIIRDGITLCFRFANTPKTSQPLHGESIKTNTFEKGNMEGGGSGEGGDI